MDMALVCFVVCPGSAVKHVEMVLVCGGSSVIMVCMLLWLMGSAISFLSSPEVSTLFLLRCR